MSLLRNLLWSGGTAALLSATAASALSRIENGRADSALDAVSHIAWGGPPPYRPGRQARNLLVGTALHAGASLFWAAVFEGVFGAWSRQRGSNALLAGAATAAGGVAAGVLAAVGLRQGLAHARRLETPRHTWLLQLGHPRMGPASGVGIAQMGTPRRPGANGAGARRPERKWRSGRPAHTSRGRRRKAWSGSDGWARRRARAWTWWRSTR